jgi:hypothetical protein
VTVGLALILAPTPALILALTLALIVAAAGAKLQ